MSARRPLASRDAGWARRAAGWLTARGVAPDRISQASVGCAALALGLLWLARDGGWGAALAFVLAGVAVQGRLICNLLDGMVAVEGGRGGPRGAFWNEAPDRAADALILWGAGLACGAPALGLGCAVAALGTAYLRALGAALGHGEDFGGPLAKPQRMAAVTALCALSAVEAVLWGTRAAMEVGLWAVLAGTLLTCGLRARRLLRRMG